MQLAENTSRYPAFFRLATFVLVVAVLRVAQDVLLPVAFAVLLAFLLSPLVVRLMRWKFPKAIAIIVTVTTAFAAIGGIGWIVTSQAIGLVRELPNYEQNLHRKIVALKQPHTPAVISRMAGMVQNLQREIQAPKPEPAPPPAVEPVEPKPVPVEVRPTEPTPWQVAREIVGPILRPLGVAGIVVVFVVAMLFQREDLRDRFLKLVSAGNLTVATQALDDAANRVSRYLGMQLVVNALYGIPVGVGLYLIGIPNALLWGLLATLLRFIPFVGPWIAAAFPLALSIAVDPGWTMLFYALGLFVVMELVSNNIIELVLYGASTGISNLALLVAAVFWTWLWGPAGLVLSTPLTVCLLVVGKYVPGLNFLNMLLGSQPVLEPSAQFYQRMLSMESEDMYDLAAKHIEQHSVEEFYDEIFLPALLMSEQDRHSGALPEVRQRFIFQASRELIEELQRQDEIAQLEGTANDTRGQPSPAVTAPPAVLGLPARDEADELAALMLSHLLHRRGISTCVSSLHQPLDQALGKIEHGQVKAVFVSALPPSALSAARQMCRRVRLRSQDARLVVGLWQHSAQRAELRDRLQAMRPDEIVRTLNDAVSRIEAQVSVRIDTPIAALAPKVVPQHGE